MKLKTLNLRLFEGRSTMLGYFCSYRAVVMLARYVGNEDLCKQSKMNVCL